MIESQLRARPPAGTDRRPRLLETDRFVADLHRRLGEATRRIDVQLMTFDGDRSGLPVAAALSAAARRGVPVRLVVDSFANRFVSDTPVGRPAVRAEHRRTRRMFDELAEAGVELRFTHPNGPFRIFALARNHKKLFLIDDTAYVGGVNISDHNFAWHDFMVRLDDPAVVAELDRDFRATLAGNRQELHGPVVVTNAAVERTFDRMVARATRRVVVASPYALDRALIGRLAACPAPDRLVVLAPENNFRSLDLVTPYLHRRLLGHGVRVAAYRRFSHAKFLLADDRILVGSSNYGRHSFWCNQEVGLVIDDAAFVAAVERDLLHGQLDPLPDPSGRLGHEIGRFGSGFMLAGLWLYARLLAGRVPALDRSRAPWR